MTRILASESPSSSLLVCCAGGRPGLEGILPPPPGQARSTAAGVLPGPTKPRHNLTVNQCSSIVPSPHPIFTERPRAAPGSESVADRNSDRRHRVTRDLHTGTGTVTQWQPDSNLNVRVCHGTAFQVSSWAVTVARSSGLRHSGWSGHGHS